MISHKYFNILALVSFFVLIPIVSLYNYYHYHNNTFAVYILKPIPIVILMIGVIFYFAIYKMHIYPLFVLFYFIFNLLGDVLLMLYSPVNKPYLIVGGISFAIGRLIMSAAFILYPFRVSKTYKINTTRIKILLSGFVSGSWTIGLCIYFCIYVDDLLMKILLPGYFIVMGINLFMALVRINGYDLETLSSQLLGALGTILFNISDTLLFWNLFIHEIKYGDAVSITLYWVSMYIIMLSIVRTNSPSKEKNNFNLYYTV